MYMLPTNSDLDVTIFQYPNSKPKHDAHILNFYVQGAFGTHVGQLFNYLSNIFQL